jgi:hypothetical protein
MWAQVAATAIGIWLTAAPAIIGFDGVAATNCFIVGPVIATMACVAIAEVTRPVRRANYVLGGWMALAPFVLGFQGRALVVSVVSGAAVIVLSRFHGRVATRYGGGWKRAWPWSSVWRAPVRS